MRRLSEHFTLEELTFSEYATRQGLDNNPDAEVVANLVKLVEHSLEPLRMLLDRAIVVSSGYRSVAVNAAIGGSSTSQHCLGQAADITVPGMSVEEVFRFAAQNVPFDQLIQEFDKWLHISYCLPARGQTLRAHKSEGKTIYTPSWVKK